jgi:hypothetical protein
VRIIIREGEKYRAEYESVWSTFPWMLEEIWWDGRIHFDIYIELKDKNGEYNLFKPYSFGQIESWFNLEKIEPKWYMGIMDIDGDGVLEIITLKHVNMYVIFDIYDIVNGKIVKINEMYLYK